MPDRVVVLSGQSLFVEGIESRLREYPKRLDVHHIDPGTSDYVESIKLIQPSAVVIDSASEDNAQCCFLCELLMAFQSMMIVRLAVDQRDVQVIKSSTHQFSGVQELIDVLENHP